MNKICSRCGIEKDVGEFYKTKGQKDSIGSYCKKCVYNMTKKYRLNNPDKIKQYQKQCYKNNSEYYKQYAKQRYKNNPEKVKRSSRQWRLKNPEKKKQYDNQWNLDNAEKIKEYHKQRYKENKEYHKQYCKEYRKNNPEKVKQTIKRWRLNNPEKVKQYAKKWQLKNPDYVKQYKEQWKLDNPDYFNQNRKQRRETDIAYNILCKCRHRQYQALRGNPKSAHTMELIGCSIEFFKSYLFTKFHDEYPGLTLHIPACDLHHIIACHTFNLSIPEQQFKCFHYTNVKLMPREEHKKLHKEIKYV